MFTYLFCLWRICVMVLLLLKHLVSVWFTNNNVNHSVIFLLISIMNNIIVLFEIRVILLNHIQTWPVGGHYSIILLNVFCYDHCFHYFGTSFFSFLGWLILFWYFALSWFLGSWRFRLWTLCLWLLCFLHKTVEKETIV